MCVCVCVCMREEHALIGYRGRERANGCLAHTWLSRNQLLYVFALPCCRPPQCPFHKGISIREYGLATNYLPSPVINLGILEPNCYVLSWAKMKSFTTADSEDCKIC